MLIVLRRTVRKTQPYLKLSHVYCLSSELQSFLEWFLGWCKCVRILSPPLVTCLVSKIDMGAMYLPDLVSIAVPLFTNSETAAVTPLRWVWNFLWVITQWKGLEPNVSWQTSSPMHLNYLLNGSLCFKVVHGGAGRGFCESFPLLLIFWIPGKEPYWSAQFVPTNRNSNPWKS